MEFLIIGQSILECTVKSSLNPPGSKPAAASSTKSKDSLAKSTDAAPSTSTPPTATSSTPPSAESAEKASATPTFVAPDTEAKKAEKAEEAEEADELADDEADAEAAEPASAATPPSSSALANAPRKKRKRVRNSDASDIEGYQGPWAKLEGEASSIPDPVCEDLIRTSVSSLITFSHLKR